MERLHALPRPVTSVRAAFGAVAVLLLASLSGCATNAWVKSGVSPEQAGIDASACRRLAYREHPVYIEAGRDALSAPMPTSCHSAGIDNARAPCAIGQATRLDVRHRDLNERPRERAFGRCLSERGYVYARVE